MRENEQRKLWILRYQFLNLSRKEQRTRKDGDKKNEKEHAKSL